MERADTDRTEKEKQNWKSGKLDYMLLGQQIKKYRVQKKLRQKDLAALVYTTTNTISRVEVGSIGCSLELLLSIAEVLEVSPDALLFGNFNPLFSRFYPYFWEMKDAISKKIAESLQEIFTEMDQKEELLLVEKDFREWVSRFYPEGEKEGEAKEKEGKGRVLSNASEQTMRDGMQKEDTRTKETNGKGKASHEKHSVKEEVQGHAFSEERPDKTVTDGGLSWKASIGGRKKKSDWFAEEFAKDVKRRKEEEERVRKEVFREEVLKEEDRIRKMEEEVELAREKLREKVKREESFSYAADSFLFPKREIAEARIEENVVQKKAEKPKQRVRFKRGER